MPTWAEIATAPECALPAVWIIHECCSKASPRHILTWSTTWRTNDKHPNPKHQDPEKLQPSKHTILQDWMLNILWCLDVEVWTLSGLVLTELPLPPPLV